MNSLLILLAFIASSFASVYYKTPEVATDLVSVEEMWDIVTDFPKYNDWNSVCTFELQGPLAMGTDIHINVTYPGMTLQSVERITVFDKPNKIGWSYRGLVAQLGLAHTQRNVVIKSENGKTIVYGEISFEGLLGRISWFLMGPKLIKMLDIFNNDLIKYVESKTFIYQRA